MLHSAGDVLCRGVRHSTSSGELDGLPAPCYTRPCFLTSRGKSALAMPLTRLPRDTRRVAKGRLGVGMDVGLFWREAAAAAGIPPSEATAHRLWLGMRTASRLRTTTGMIEALIHFDRAHIVLLRSQGRIDLPVSTRCCAGAAHDRPTRRITCGDGHADELAPHHAWHR